MAINNVPLSSNIPFVNTGNEDNEEYQLNNIFSGIDTILKDVDEALEGIIAGEISFEWGNLTGTLSDQTDLQNALNDKADSNHTHPLSDITDAGTAAAEDTGTASGDLALLTTGGVFADERISESSITQHEGAIDHDALTNFVANEHIDHSTVDINAGTGLSGGGDITASRTINLDAAISDLNNVTITSVSDDELLAFNSGTGEWINQTAAEAGLAASGHTHDASDIVSGTFADARIAESNVTQHEAAIDHDALINFVANEHIDWTADQGATNINGANIAVKNSVEVDSGDVQLVNDEASPGAQRFYGTTLSTGVKGWVAAEHFMRFADTGGSVNTEDRVGTRTEVNFASDGAVSITPSFGPDIAGYPDSADIELGIRSKNSIEEDSHSLQLDGDADSPPPLRFYSTNILGNKGFHDASHRLQFADVEGSVLESDFISVKTDIGFVSDSGGVISITPSYGPDLAGYPEDVEIELDARKKNSIEADSGSLQLVGDEASPGNSKYYGTGSGGSKGFHDLPDGLSSVSSDSSLDGDGTSGDPLSIASVNVNLLSGSISYSNLPFSSSDVSNWNAAFGWGDHASAGYLDGVKNSLEIDSGDVQLVNDEASPGNNKVYGTDGSGTKGYKDDFLSHVGWGSWQLDVDHADTDGTTNVFSSAGNVTPVETSGALGFSSISGRFTENTGSDSLWYVTACINLLGPDTGTGIASTLVDVFIREEGTAIQASSRAEVLRAQSNRLNHSVTVCGLVPLKATTGYFEVVVQGPGGGSVYAVLADSHVTAHKIPGGK